jgi:hypothetical protein
MECYLVQNGGGASLNFKVICNPQPSTAKENTIWVDTDHITSYEFRATEPSAPLEGMVWIKTGTSSTVEFNALKKNGIQVYPISVSQYVGGTWVSKTAKTYQNGELTGWERYLYKSGDEFDSFTGGWIGEDRTFRTANGGAVPTITRNPTSLSATVAAYRGGVVRVQNAIDLTGYSKLEFNGVLKDVYSILYIWTSTSGFVQDNVAAKLEGPVDGVGTIDLSSIPDGKYYIGLALYHTGAAVTMNSLKLT